MSSCKHNQYLLTDPIILSYPSSENLLNRKKKWAEELSLGRAETVKSSLVNKYGIDESRLLTKGFGGSVPLQGPKGIDSKRVEIRVVGALSAASSNTLPRTAVENTEAPFIKAHAAKIAFKKAADAQDGAAKAESKRIANEEKERTKREKLRRIVKN